MGTFLKNPPDFQRHNDEVRQVMTAYAAGRPTRVPVKISMGITCFIQNPDLNTQGWTYEDYFTRPEVQIQAQLAFQNWRNNHILQDELMGLPEGGFWLEPDFQNSYDATWCGCELKYLGNQLPDTLPMLAQEKERLYDLPPLLPVDGGLVGRWNEFQAYMMDYAVSHEYLGRPLRVAQRNIGEATDGVFDLACKLRGVDALMLDMLTDEVYFHDLMQWITNNLIHRIAELRRRRWERWPDSSDCGRMKTACYLADDAIAMISHECYTQYVYPYHRQLVNALCDGSYLFMHLCGSNMHHFQGLHKKLGVTVFDTGFTVDHGLMRSQLGPEVEIIGGPTVMTVKNGTPQEIMEHTRAVLESGVTEGGRFILTAANNLPPNTPVENLAVLYEAAHLYGTYC